MDAKLTTKQKGDLIKEKKIVTGADVESGAVLKDVSWNSRAKVSNPQKAKAEWQKQVDFRFDFDGVLIARLLQLSSKPIIIAKSTMIRNKFAETPELVPAIIRLKVVEFGTGSGAKKPAMEKTKDLIPELTADEKKELIKLLTQS